MKCKQKRPWLLGKNNPMYGKKCSEQSKRMKENNPMKRPEIAIKTSQALKGRKRPDLSEKWKINNPMFHPEIRAKLSGENNHMYGKHHTKETKQKISSKLKGYVYTEERNKKISEALTGRKRPDISAKLKNRPSWNKGILMSLETRKKMSLSRSGIKHSIKTKQKMSNSMFDRINNNNGINPGLHRKAGWFNSLKNKKEIPYDSSYELLAYQILEQLKKVKCYSRCKFSIDYKFKDSIHKYIPDIIVTYDDSSQEIIEIKPEKLLYDECNQAKFNAAKNYCNKENLKFSIWTENQLYLAEGKQ